MIAHPKKKKKECTWNERPKDTSNQGGREQSGMTLKGATRLGTAEMGREPGVCFN